MHKRKGRFMGERRKKMVQVPYFLNPWAWYFSFLVLTLKWCLFKEKMSNIDNQKPCWSIQKCYSKCAQDYIRMMNFGVAKNVFYLFSSSVKWCGLAAKGCCPLGKSIQLFSLIRTSFLDQEKKCNGLSFTTTSFYFRTKSFCFKRKNC